jgi:hypothetical protein
MLIMMHEGRISLGPPNNVATTYEREDQRAAWMAAHLLGTELAPSTGSTSPPPSPLNIVIQRGGEGVNL